VREGGGREAGMRVRQKGAVCGLVGGLQRNKESKAMRDRICRNKKQIKRERFGILRSIECQGKLHHLHIFLNRAAR